jgi:hypothetical protein
MDFRRAADIKPPPPHKNHTIAYTTSVQSIRQLRNQKVLAKMSSSNHPAAAGAEQGQPTYFQQQRAMLVSEIAQV